MASMMSSPEMRASQASLHFEDSDSDKENAMAVPLVKPAATTDASKLLQVEDSSDQDDEDDEDEESGENAYERVKRQLLGGQLPTGESQPTHAQSTTQSRSASSDAASSHGSPTRAPIGRIARRMQLTHGGKGTNTSAVTTKAPRGANTLQAPAQSDEDDAAPALSPRSHSSVSEQDEQDRFEDGSEVDRATNLSPRQNLVALAASDSSDSEVPAVPSRLQALVERKRAERMAREKAIEDAQQAENSESMPEQVTKAAAKSQKQKRVAIVVSDKGSGNDDEEGADQRLTQYSKPTRKASKKALDEMSRETQRMQRNMQLTHMAKTKTKFTKDDLFKKFNFRQSKVSEAEAVTAEHSEPVTAIGSSDAEAGPSADTPPSSPPDVANAPVKPATDTVPGEEAVQAAEDSDSDDLQRVLQKLRKQMPPPQEPTKSAKPSVREFLKRSGKKRASVVTDDDLELVQHRLGGDGGVALLDRPKFVAPRQSHAVHALHALANLHSHEVPRNKQRVSKKSYAPSELSQHLQRLARQQALAERNEKIQALKDKGIYVQTAEEREKDQLQLENMLEKARQEALELAQREKDAAKRDGKDVEGELPDSDEDEDYVASDEEQNEEQVELSGSEDEASQGDDEQSDQEDSAEESGEPHPSAMLVDDIASEADDNDADRDDVVERMSDDEQVLGDNSAPPRRRNRKLLIDSDDEDDGGVIVASTPIQTRNTPKTPKSALAAAFGFGHAPASAPGLSQMFAGTMAQSQDDCMLPGSGDVNSQVDALEFLRGVAPPSMSNFGIPESPLAARDSENFLVRESPALGDDRSTFRERSQVSGTDWDDAQGNVPPPTTQVDASQMPDATQDEGFQSAFSPARPFLKAPPASHTTVDTVPLAEMASSPLVQRRGRLQRGQRGDGTVAGTDDDNAGADEFEVSANAFDVMRKASRQAPEISFDAKHSKAKEMVEEQAEESEDEYAGLGGASDDESAGELDEETRKQLIDDETVEKLNERQVAAYYADKERADDEKRVEKLFKDIANGGLRRKRGADLELWDSDDEDEASRRRRAMKQREFAKMRRALLADEKLGKIAENPKQAAFLQAIADREQEDEVFFLDAPEGLQEGGDDSDVQMGADMVGDTQDLDNVAGPNNERTVDKSQTHRRTAASSSRRAGQFTRPTTLQDIRDTLSELIGEPAGGQHSDQDDSDDSDEDNVNIVPDSQPARSPSAAPEQHANSEDDEMNDAEIEQEKCPMKQQQQQKQSTNPRRRPADATRMAVVDRMAVKRSRSSSLAAKNDATSSAASFRQAFFTPSAAAGASFKVPSLLRRATTNASNESMDHEPSNAGGMGKEVVKMGGSKRSSVNYHVRDKERRAKVEEVERARRESTRRVGMLRRNRIVSGLSSTTSGGSGFED